MNYLEDLINQEQGLLITTGKGGVGKTTVSALLGLLRSLNNKKTYLISTDPFHSFSDAYGLRRAFEQDPIEPNKKKKLNKRLRKGLFNLLRNQLENSNLPESIKKGLNKKELLKGELIIKQLEPTGRKINKIKDKIINGIYTEYELLAGREIIEGYEGLIILDTDSLEGFQRLVSYAYDNKGLMKKLKSQYFQVMPVTTSETMSLEKVNNFFSQPVIKEFCKPEHLAVNNVNKNSWVEFIDSFSELRNAKKIILYEQPFEPQGIRLISLINKPRRELKVRAYELASKKLPDKRITLFCGKGGQGKTTMACAYALKQAMKGKKVYIMSADAVSSLPDSFNTYIPEYDPEINEGSPWFDLSKTKAYNGLKIMVYKEDSYLDSIPGIPFYCAMKEVIKNHDCLIIDAPPSGNIRKSLETGRKDYDLHQEFYFNLDLFQLKLRKVFSEKTRLLLDYLKSKGTFFEQGARIVKSIMSSLGLYRLRNVFSEKTGLMLGFLKNRRHAFEKGAKVIKSDDFMAVTVMQPTRTALNETLSLESMLTSFEINPYLGEQYCIKTLNPEFYEKIFGKEKPFYLILNKVSDKPYQQQVLKTVNELFMPSEDYNHILIPLFKEEVKGRAMLEEVANYL